MHANLMLAMRLFVASTLLLTVLLPLLADEPRWIEAAVCAAGIALGVGIALRPSRSPVPAHVAPLLVYIAVRIAAFVRPESTNLDQAADALFAIAGAAWLVQLVRPRPPEPDPVS